MNDVFVLAVDDEPKILDIVKSYLEKSGYTALTAKNGREALEALQRHPVALILLDLMLPDLSGEELCRQVRAHSDVPIIMMTAKVEEEHIIHGLSIGADDYVTKPFSPRQLMARVAAMLRRSTNLAGSLQGTLQSSLPVYRYDTLTVDTESKRAFKGDAPLALTPNEYRILALLISRPQKIFTRDEIIETTKSDDYDGFDRSIDAHVSNLRQKIEDDPKNPRFVKTVYGMGYRFGGEE
ncbi:MAG: response regulator transcription factor [Treponema sp.]|jgi:DNA-binding response OmpR family regulator|nr:response regulator transcription factor [Treponema sp.]